MPMKAWMHREQALVWIATIIVALMLARSPSKLSINPTATPRRPTANFRPQDRDHTDHEETAGLLSHPNPSAINAPLRNGRSVAHNNDHVEILIELDVVLSTLALRLIDFVEQGALLVLFLNLAAGATKSF
jgi:hypothetical protein